MRTPVRGPSDPAGAAFTGACHGYASIEAIAAGVAIPRALVVGTAGAGKTSLLVRLQDLLVRHGWPVRGVDDDTAVRDVPVTDVLVVDDLHLQDPARLGAIRARAADPDAALIVATRPWPRSTTMVDIWRSLEADVPPIILGQVSRSDVLTHLEDSGGSLTSSCLDELVTITGGVAWLMSRALTIHGDRDCRDDPTHVELRRGLEAQIAHRLNAVEEPLRRLVERISLGDLSHVHGDTAAIDELVEHGHTEGLMLRNGSLLPVVRSAARAGLPPHRVVELSAVAADGIARAASEDDPSYGSWLGDIGDVRIATALAGRADQVLDTDPPRARELYRAAVASGLDPARLATRQALAAWGSGDVDAAAGFVDVALADQAGTDPSDAADVSAAVWAARGMMATASEVYALLPPPPAGPSGVRATITHLGVGRVDRASGPDPTSSRGGATRHGDSVTAMPSTLGIAMGQLEAGLRSALEQEPSPTTLTQLVRASELFTAARANVALPELPAVVTAAVAVGAGDLATARRVVDAAVTGVQAGEWARRRLLLWQSWLAIQAERPGQARAALAEAEAVAYPFSPRDELLRQAIRVTLARRYEDVQSLEATWSDARESVRHIDADLYCLLPLASLICASARLGDSATLAPHLTRGFEILHELGSPPLWTTHLNWAGVQQGILLNRPDALGPYAGGLVAAAPHSGVADVMARAGRVWASVLSGSVDPEAVEHAARSLAGVGLAWDGARLAGHGASRTEDRKVAATLLACARELHPPAAGHPPAPVAEPAAAPTEGAEETQLSKRELDVARLVLQGKTYVEIGQMIFISPRTVEHHMARVRRRLGATSRSDLIAKLRLVVEPTGGRNGGEAHRARPE